MFIIFLGSKEYYCDSNIPEWFPKDLPFKPPTHRSEHDIHM